MTKGTVIESYIRENGEIRIIVHLGGVGYSKSPDEWLTICERITTEIFHIAFEDREHAAQIAQRIAERW